MFRTRVLAVLATAATAVLPQAQSEAVSSIAYTFAINCASGAPVTSLVDLPQGTYAVAAAGACTIYGSSTSSIPVDTCARLPVGTVPCVSTGISVNNVPSEACGVAYGAGEGRVCAPSWVTYGCGIGSVRVDGQCPSLGIAGTIYHGHSGPMTAGFHDSNYADNIGVMTVTVVWTGL